MRHYTATYFVGLDGERELACEALNFREAFHRFAIMEDALCQEHPNVPVLCVRMHDDAMYEDEGMGRVMRIGGGL